MQLTIEVSGEVAEWLNYLAGVETMNLAEGVREVSPVMPAEVATFLLSEAFNTARDADEIPYLPTPKIGPFEEPVF